MSLATRIQEYVRAGFSGLWIQSFEQEDALAEIAGLARDQRWRLACWDSHQGLSIPNRNGPADAADTGATVANGAGDPLAALRSLDALATPDSAALLVLRNFHRFLGSAELVQATACQIERGKRQGMFLLVLAPAVNIPLELEKHFIVLEHDLPDRDQLTAIARAIATEPGEFPEDRLAQEALLDAAAGLTRFEAEGAYSLSLVRQGKLVPQTLWELKSQMLKKSGLLQLYRGAEAFSSLGGLAALKAFTKRALLQPSRGNPLKRPRGVLLLSPPGCGKSQFCKALGQETHRPVLVLDVGSLMGSLVGQTEERTRQALRIADAMAPCVLMVDEVEKAFAGAGSSGQTDSGVSARMFGSFLTWLNDHASDVFVVCTANDVSRLPPEFARAERFDGVFFLDLPARPERELIWTLYLDQFELDSRQPRPDDDQWTGAEIRACCRLAALLDLPLLQAAQNVVPVAVTSAESVERLRTWASGRCLAADKPGIYQRNVPALQTARKVTRDPSNN